MFEIRVVEKIKTHILCSITFFHKSHRLRDDVEKYGGGRGATNDVTIWRIRVACWIRKAICTYWHAKDHAPQNPHARTQADAHRQMCNTYCFSTTTKIRERASILRYTYTVCLVTYIYLLIHIFILKKNIIKIIEVLLEKWALYPLTVLQIYSHFKNFSCGLWKTGTWYRKTDYRFEFSKPKLAKVTWSQTIRRKIFKFAGLCNQEIRQLS
jgi:hypothetical protein